MSHPDEPLDDLEAQLRAISARHAIESPAYVAEIEAFVERLTGVGAGASTPGPGARFPDFLLVDARGRLTRLDDVLGEGPVVLTLVRGHWCPYCRAYTRILTGRREQFGDAKLVIVSPERARYAPALLESSLSEVTVLNDLDNGLAVELGLFVALDEKIVRLLAAFGDDLTAYMGGGGWGVPIPATFVLDRFGTIIDRGVNVDHRQRWPWAAIDQAMEAARR